MVDTITPVVHGGRRSRWALAAALHVLGTASSAAALGAALGAAGDALGIGRWAPALWIAAGAAGLYALRELAGVPVPVPDARRQVPEWWRTTFPLPVASLLYGWGLGIGFYTHLGHGTLVAVALLAVASGDPLAGAILVGAFGVARGLAVLVSASSTTEERAAGLMARLERWAGTRARSILNGSALVAVAVLAAVAAARSGNQPEPGLAAEFLAVAFAWAAVAKVLRFGRWREALRAYRLPVEDGVAIVVPLAEAAIPAMVIMGRPAAAAWAALLLLGGFSGAVVRARTLQGPRLPCGCFGGRSRRDWRLLLLRNGALAGLAAVATFDRGTALGLTGPTGGDVLPAALVATAAVLALLMLRAVLSLPARAPRDR